MGKEFWSASHFQEARETRDDVGEQIPYGAASHVDAERVQFAVVSLGGNVLLDLDLPMETTVCEVELSIERELPDSGEVVALLMGDCTLQHESTLADVRLAHGSTLQVLFSDCEDELRFDKGSDSLRISVKGGAIDAFKRGHVEACARFRSCRIEGPLDRETISPIPIQVVGGDFVLGLLNTDIQLWTTGWDDVGNRDITNYAESLETRPRLAARIEMILQRADLIQFYYYEFEEEVSCALSGGCAELLVDGRTHISLYHAW